MTFDIFKTGELAIKRAKRRELILPMQWEPPKLTAKDATEARERVGLTQEQAAKVIYRSQRCWQNWEKGTPIDPGLFHLFLLKTKQAKCWQSYFKMLGSQHEREAFEI